MVETAQREVESNRFASQAMREFSTIRLADAEVGARRVLVKYGLSCPVPLSWMKLGEEATLEWFPWVKLSDWAQHILNIGMLPRILTGVSSFSKMKVALSVFWQRYQSMDPGHPVFGLARAGTISLDQLIPYYSHSDEGRTFRDGALWVLNVHGVLGRGTLAFLKAGKHRAPLDQNEQGLNYVGNTWSTHCLIATMMKEVATPDALSTFLSAFAADAHFLLHTGITNGNERVWLIHMGCKGDLPALAKIAHFTRTFGNAPKAAQSKKPCRGVCWRCLAGQERDDDNHRIHLPYEDVSSHPVWETSIGQELPWTNRPSILEGLDLDDGRAVEFFQTDYFHNAHLGVLKSFSSSAIVGLIEADPALACFAGCSSVEARFERLTEFYKDFFKRKGRKPWISELSRDLVCWPMSSACPAAKWNKGMATVEVMQFIDWFSQEHLSESNDPIMKSIVFRLQVSREAL